MEERETIQPSQLLNTVSPDAVLEEVKYNFVFSYPVKEFFKIRDSFRDFRRLFSGNYPGYKKCTAPYHNINHSCDVFLALSRIIDGYNIENKTQLPVDRAKLVLITALLHDSGHIPEDSDQNISGAQLMQEHVKRSIRFTLKYLKSKNYSPENLSLAEKIIQATDSDFSIEDINFSSKNQRLLASMLATADFIGQMAARTYLERLLYLYQEFRDAGIPTYSSEYELLKKTEDFYTNVALPKLKNDFGNIKRYSSVHFRKRYNIQKDLYQETIEKNIKYLSQIIKTSPQSYRQKLRRKE